VKLNTFDIDEGKARYRFDQGIQPVLLLKITWIRYLCKIIDGSLECIFLTQRWNVLYTTLATNHYSFANASAR
jgi:hypothetical protein